jgi:hypothetical protein
VENSRRKLTWQSRDPPAVALSSQDWYLQCSFRRLVAPPLQKRHQPSFTNTCTMEVDCKKLLLHVLTSIHIFQRDAIFKNTCFYITWRTMKQQIIRVSLSQVRDRSFTIHTYHVLQTRFWVFVTDTCVYITCFWVFVTDTCVYITCYWVFVTCVYITCCWVYVTCVYITCNWRFIYIYI